MKKQLFILSVLVLMGLSSFAQHLMEVKEFTLPNGLTVFLNEDHSKSEVFGMVMVKAGSKNDPNDATGMAHYMEHMLFKGTEELGTTSWEKEKPHIEKIFALYDELGQTKDEVKRKEIQLKINEESVKANQYAIPNEMDKVIKMMGGTNMNANTSEDRTAYFNTFPSNQIERWLDLYSHRFHTPVFRGFQSELEVVYEEQNMYSEMFQTQIREEYNRHFFKQHPYGQQTVIGTVEHLKNPSLTKMYEFFKTYYVANNMALVLVGDFNSEDIIPIIEAKFGMLPSGKLPKMPEYKETPFNGRELVEVKLSPIKIGMLGWRTPQYGHKDEIVMDIVSQIMSNGSETGLLDQLSLQNKMMGAMYVNMKYNDYGSANIFFIPKFIGQSLENAEQLVLDQMQKLRAGDFDEGMVDAIKKQMYVSYKRQLEDLQAKALLIGENFGRNKSLEDLNTYLSRLNKITKEDVVAAANKYFGDNYLAFFSSMGKKGTEKIAKPGFKPVVSNTTAKSPYTQRFENMPVKEQQVRFVDFEKAMETSEITKGHTLYTVNNPVNDIFSLTIQIGVGTKEMPSLKFAADLMNTAGTADLSVEELKAEFSRLGCNYYIGASDSYINISLSGMEENIAPALNLLSKLIRAPELEQNKIDLLVDGQKSERKMERTEIDNLASALFSYVKYKEASSYIDRSSIKEIKKLKAEQLTNAFVAGLNYETQYHFSGNTSSDELAAMITKYYQPSTEVMASTSPYTQPVEKYNENTVFFVNKKKAVQSKIYFMANAATFTPDEKAMIDAFNLYFGGDFSGLVMQEIREYRSMAYNAGAVYTIPVRNGEDSYFLGMLGTQADKSIDAITIFDSLVRKMPHKAERMEMIKQFLTQSLGSGQPDFRSVSRYINAMRLKGYADDPAKSLLTAYEEMTFEDIYNFYVENIQNKSMVIAVVGDKSRIDMDALAKFGKIINIKKKKLFK